jgi:CheY-like chemotaxis protein
MWRGIWQVPVNFAKGRYEAKLSAVDVGGNLFEGYSDPFTVMELAMVTLVSPLSREAAPAAPISEKITPVAPPRTAEVSEQAIIKIINKLMTQPVPGPTPKLEPTEKSALIDRNLELGKSSLSAGNAAAAANYFRIMLFLDPGNKIAGSYLAEAQVKIAQERSRRVWVLGLGIAGSAIGAIILLMLFRLLWIRPAPVKPQEAPAAPAAVKPALSDKERETKWRQALGWRENPFTADVLKQLFISNNPLEMNGFTGFIRARIESVGGRDNLPFTAAALEKIYSLSKGKPKDALNICAWAVAEAIKADRSEITAEAISQYEEIRQKTILIADDEEIIRTSLDAILRRGGGYQTDFAIDGEDAINKIRHNVYSLVLLDIAMPKIDGYEILKQVRQRYSDLPVIYVTGKGTPQQTLESISKYNLTGYIEKPFTPEKVLEVVAKALHV